MTISFKQVSKSFGGQQVLRDASFLLGDGERVGIVGPNGAGKSTIFSLICSELTPDSGVVERSPGSRLGLLRQEIDSKGASGTLLEYVESARSDLERMESEIASLDKALSEEDGENRSKTLERLGELQTRFEAQGGYDRRTRARAALGGLGFTEDDFDRPFQDFSGGWQMRAELARVLVARPDVLLLDEPTNYLDIPAIEWLQRFLRAFPGTMVLISHDRYLLNTLTAVTVEIANAQAVRYEGCYDFYVRERMARHEHRMAAYRNQQRERERTERFIERFRAKNTKATQVQSRVKALERMEEITLPRDVVSPGKIRLRKCARSGQEVVRLENIGVTYDGERWVLRGIDLSIQRGRKIALIGMNGMGKSTLLRVLSGRLKPGEGRRVLGHKVAVGYQSQDFTETMDTDLTVFDTVRNAGNGATDQEVRTLLGGMGFSGDSVQKRIGVLSGGEKVRVAFARLLIDPPNFLLLDEPTTHLDVTAREALENALRDFEGTVCLVSHDIEFVRKTADEVIAMVPPGIRRYYGGYDYYCEKRAEESGEAGGDAGPVRLDSTDRKAARRERARIVQEISVRTRELKKTVRNAERRIEELEQEQSELTARLASPDDLDFEKVNRRLSEISVQIEENTVLWEKSATELEQAKNEIGKTSK